MRSKYGFSLFDADFALFDGEGGGEGAAAPAAAAAQGDAGAGQQQGQGAPQQAQSKDTDPQASDKERRSAFQTLINGEYKDLYDQSLQRVASNRVKEAARLRQQMEGLQPVLDTLSRRYGVDGSDPARLAQAIESDTALWAEAAEQAGMSVEQYNRMRQLEQQNARFLAQQRDSQARYLAERKYQQWVAEAETVKAEYPEFDFASLQGNELFGLMLKNGFPMKQAYRAVMVDDIEARAKAEQEKAVTDNIRAKGARPREAGGTGGAFTVKEDVSKMSREQVLSVLGRIEKGELRST